MSHTAKGWAAIIVIIVVIVIAGAWYSMSRQSSYTAPVAPVPAAQQSAPATQASSDTNASMSSPSDTSDATLQSDLNSTDDQMNSLNTDAAASAQ